MRVGRFALMVMLLAVAPSDAQAGGRKHVQCKAAKAIEHSRCLPKRVRQALPEQQLLQPLLVDPIESLLLPPLQGVATPVPDIPQFPLEQRFH